MRLTTSRYGLSTPVPTHCRRAAQRLARYQSTATSTSDEPTTPSLSPRWLSDIKTRVGKCINFGLDTPQTMKAGSILQEIAVDWRELTVDCVTGHVNNVIYNRYAESARVNWALNFANTIDPAHKSEWTGLVTPSGIGMILRSIRTDYKFPMKWPDRVTVLHKLRNKPTSDTDHFILDVMILSEVHRRPAARCVEDIVIYDYKGARKMPLQPFMVDKFKETFELQEQAKETYGKRVTELTERVRELEQDSWDRPDAKEDFGSAENP
ncbi:thioesterase-like superfamily-domain-containing protein [Massariosphaeria phaeospora]|uniref:Thioesterase-like superfamily-domain-containing protein n=1 Tax=Massariosphaeria phaeospora TaxID=100035 RepID=A0A7C8M5J7_9PLEO|nr:thioesterase-like superfamily-domain-containing protein [Massariosphaeria phaeospora]